MIERTYNEFLYPSGVNRPTFDKLASGMDDSQVTATITGRVTGGIPRDTVIEIDFELMLVDTVVGNTINLHPTLGRGHLETAAATHAASAPVYVDPKYSKQAIFNAIKTVIGTLYPRGVYARKVDRTQLFTTRGVIDAPAGATKVLAITARDGLSSPVYLNQLRKGIDFIEFMEFTPPKIQLLRGGTENGEMHIVYKTEPTIPASVTDDLDTLSSPIPSRLQNYLPMAAAAYLLQGKEPSRTQIEDIRRALASQGIQVGSALNVGNQLLGLFYNQYVAPEADRLREQDSVGIEFVRR